MAETTSLRGTPDQFIVLCGQIIGNGADGFQTIYGWDGEIHADRKSAIAAGWKERDSDDFNIGVIRDGRLASLDWMDEPLNESGEGLIEIEEQIDWRDPRDTFEVGQEADGLQQDGGESDFAWLARLRTHFIDPTALAEAVAAARAETGFRIVFDGPPGPVAGRFVEVEDALGRSFNAGEWRARPDGYYELKIDSTSGQSAWQPIETAPIWGGPILAYEGGTLIDGSPYSWIDVVEFRQPDKGLDGWYSVGDHRGPPSCNPTHWQPLPAPPTTPGGRTDG